MKNQEYDDDDCDAEDSHVLLGFDESTSSFNHNNNKSYNADAFNGTTTTTTTGVATTNGSSQYFRWTPESIKMMLTMRFDMEHHFSQRLRQKKDLWNEIATEMGRLGGYVITGEVCDLKFRNMLQTYKKNRLKEERGLQELIIWEYYAVFKEAMSNSDNDQLIPSMLCESVCNDDTCSDTVVMIPQSSGEEKKPIEIVPEEVTTITTPKILLKPNNSSKRKRQRRLSVHSQTDLSSEDHEAVIIEPQPMPTEKLPEIVPEPPQPQQQQQQLQLDLSSASSIPNHKADTSQTHTRDTPPWLTPAEQNECEVFGQSVGLQLANVRNSYSRALLKLKIQELIFLAGTGKLPDNYRFCYD